MNARRQVATVARRAAWLVFALALLAYGTATAGAFVFDDVHSVAANAAVHDLGNAARFFVDPALFSSDGAVMYRPVLLLSYALNLVFGGGALVVKAGNVLLHGLCAVVALSWAWSLSRSLRASVCLAALFAVHPLASEAVNLASARSELLLVLGLLVALRGHLRALRGRLDGRAVLAVTGGAVLACGCKETGVVLPALCLAQTWWARRAVPGFAGFGRGLWAMAPAVVVVVVYLLARHALLGQVAVPLLDRPGGDPRAGSGRTLVEQLATMGTLLPGVLAQCVWPTPLSLDPKIVFRTSFADPAVLGGWAMMITGSLWALRRGAGARTRRLGVAFAWACALPWIVVPLNAPLAEHRVYGPLLGVLLLTAPCCHRWLCALRGASLAPAFCGAFAGVLLLGIVSSAQRSWLYRDEQELWRAELAHNETSYRAHWGIGTCRVRQMDFAGALPSLARAHALYPGQPEVLMHYVQALIALPDAQAQLDTAMAAADELAAMAERDPWFRSLRAQAWLQAGRVRQDPELCRKAEAFALSCLDVAPAKGLVYQLAASACLARGDRPAALAHLDAAIARGLGVTGVRLDRAALLRELGRVAEADQELARARLQAPFDPLVLRASEAAAMPPK